MNFPVASGGVAEAKVINPYALQDVRQRSLPRVSGAKSVLKNNHGKPLGIGPDRIKNANRYK
jgi:hypothetical protein